MIDDLKRNGFKWSRFNGAWQRQLTDNAKYAVFRLTGVDVGKKPSGGVDGAVMDSAGEVEADYLIL